MTGRDVESSDRARAVRIEPLFEHPSLRATVAARIHDAFWRDSSEMTPDVLERLLADARDPDRIPLSFVALDEDGAPIGTANLIENDDPRRPSLRPWLAALLVEPDARGAGVGTALVERVLAEARRLGESRVYLGTDGPGFYERIGATIHERVRPEFVVMRFDLAD